MRQRSKAECRGGGERAVFLALPSLGLYNGTPEMLAVHRYLLLTVSEPKSGSTSQALSVIPETIPVGTNATSLTPSSALPSGADPYPGTRNEHREPQRWTTSAWSSFIFRAMPPAGQEERRPVLPAPPRAPEVQLCLTSSVAGGETSFGQAVAARLVLGVWLPVPDSGTLVQLCPGVGGLLIHQACLIYLH